MKKIYYLNYIFIDLPRHVKTDSLFVFAQALDNAMDNNLVDKKSITFHIEEVDDKEGIPND